MKEVFKTATDFEAAMDKLQQHPMFRKPFAWGVFKAQTSQMGDGKVLTGTFLCCNWIGKNLRSFAAFAHAAGMFGENGQAWEGPEAVIPLTEASRHKLLAMFKPYPYISGVAHQNAQVANLLPNLRDENKGLYQLVVLFKNAKPKSLQSAYLKLTGLSECFIKPRELNLEGVFNLLPNVAWAGNKAYDLAWLREHEVRLRIEGKMPVIDYVDKFPRYLGQVIPPDSVRILASHNVRFGAHLAEGTTVMPGASYINYNAGTLGRAMVEGRISSSATVGEGTDVGGGASILGVLSGGNSTPINIGKNCLLGANSVTGIPLGNNCVVDAGVAVLPGGKFYIPPEVQAQLAKVNPRMIWEAKSSFKGSELFGLNQAHFRQDSQTGKLVVRLSTHKVTLNEALHA